jgi:hypothetical protein
MGDLPKLLASHSLLLDLRFLFDLDDMLDRGARQAIQLDEHTSHSTATGRAIAIVQISCILQADTPRHIFVIEQGVDNTTFPVPLGTLTSVKKEAWIARSRDSSTDLWNQVLAYSLNNDFAIAKSLAASVSRPNEMNTVALRA